MTPDWWQTVMLALFAFRLTRLVGWDDLPPVVWARERALGWHVMSEEEWVEADMPDYDVGTGPLAYRRPLLAHFVHCPFCLGAWISLLVASSWWLWPHATLLVALPFALSSAVGLVAKQLDP